ncbi:MAG: family acetyltransferase [Actinomycetia bacterium]|nr:family acetyltransferase [Actinomycetes bacterium]
MLRSAQPDDHAAIVALTDVAFEGSEEALRVVRELEPEISLVYEDGGAIVGHVMLTRMEMGDHRPFQLSPLSVAPSHQNRGIGSELTREALRLADEAGEPLVLVLGHPTYYPRFGFEPATALGLEAPRDFGAAWMAVKLAAYDPAVRGRVVFPPAFG